MARKSIARATRDNAHRRIGIDDSTSHLVYSAVATYCNNHIGTLAASLGSKNSCMATICRVGNFVVEYALVYG